jgi:hypothetical protein
VSGTARLEGRYLRLLALYPAEHRRAHQEEMLGVLMTGARAGQRRPGLAESADLILGALRIRLRLVPGQLAGALWRDALAVVSTVLPMIILVYLGVLELSLLSEHGAVVGAVARYDTEHLAVWAVLTGCVLLRLRRTAALVAAGMLVGYASPAAGTPGWMYLSLTRMLIFVTPRLLRRRPVPGDALGHRHHLPGDARVGRPAPDHADLPAGGGAPGCGRRHRPGRPGRAPRRRGQRTR